MIFHDLYNGLPILVYHTLGEIASKIPKFFLETGRKMCYTVRKSNFARTRKGTVTRFETVTG